MIRAIAFLTLGLAAVAAPALADPAPQPERVEPHAGASPNPVRAQLCSRDIATIDYRACVNASTRDKNAKIRLA